jgi:hypothetical protein
MTTMQEIAIASPRATASGDAERFRRIDLPWSIILTVNK